MKLKYSRVGYPNYYGITIGNIQLQTAYKLHKEKKGRNAPFHMIFKIYYSLISSSALHQHF